MQRIDAPAVKSKFRKIWLTRLPIMGTGMGTAIFSFATIESPVTGPTLFFAGLAATIGTYFNGMSKHDKIKRAERNNDYMWDRSKKATTAYNKLSDGGKTMTHDIVLEIYRLENAWMDNIGADNHYLADRADEYLAVVEKVLKSENKQKMDSMLGHDPTTTAKIWLEQFGVEEDKPKARVKAAPKAPARSRSIDAGFSQVSGLGDLNSEPGYMEYITLDDKNIAAVMHGPSEDVSIKTLPTIRRIEVAEKQVHEARKRAMIKLGVAIGEEFRCRCCDMFTMHESKTCAQCYVEDC